MSDLPIMTLIEAAQMLDIKPDTLRHQAQSDHGRMADRPGALAVRIGLRKIGRDWYAVRSLVEAEIAARRAGPGGQR